MERFFPISKINKRELSPYQKCREAIALEFKIGYMNAGPVVVRNERGWRDNEKKIDYFWSLHISKALGGSLSIFTIKFGESSYRDIKNKSELVQGLITLKLDGELAHIYHESHEENAPDPIKQIRTFDLFDENTTFTIDGVSYDFSILVNGVESNIHLSNPSSEKWRSAISQVEELGSALAERSGHKDWIEFFES